MVTDKIFAMDSFEPDLPPRIYFPLPVLTNRQEIEELLVHGSVEELLILSLALGEHFPDWKYAQDVCLRIAEHPSEGVRANACLALAYIARTKQRLEKHLVKSILLRELRAQTEFRWRIEDAVSDINYYLEWHLGFKHEMSEKSN
ncbi:MAG: hypothetical protein KME01_05090 [Chroococcus sp. CMT-3BRIN-NPC107]|jgi:hypothetical protein|nr:hypothetical protein [Chroococcus sp. CMT-3BRIN-NPC107]